MAVKRRARSAAEIAFEFAWKVSGLKGSDITPEYVFHPTRLWRFDFAFPSQKLAIEIDGLGKRGEKGRHQTFTGISGDCQKMNEAVRLGWRVLRFPAPEKARVNEWVRLVIECLCPEASA